MKVRVLGVCLTLFISGIHLKSEATSATWIAGDGQWNVGANWSGGVSPNAAGDTATFGDTATGSSLGVVDIDPPYATVGSFVFQINQGKHFQFSGGNSLTLNNGGGGATINATGQKGAQFLLPVVLADDLTINMGSNVSEAILFEITSSISGGYSVTIDNLGTGRVIFAAPISYTGTTTLLNGSLELAGNASLDTSTGISIGSGATLTLSIDYGLPLASYTFNDLTGAGKLILIDTNAIIPSEISLEIF